ncbi:uncharacterized protein LOC128990742, partial [Macrosteles quadrilineatus]|uniref:uncharacterized protein LOC128990742 n=1 Tax=Macrosteles quadrilineatus TaxID=74068 RepID=UPI0023E20DA5
MIKVLVFVVSVTFTNCDEIEELFAQNFVYELTSEPTIVSGVAQFYTSDSSNFTEVTKSDFFIDKSLLIKELLDSKVSTFLEISAAPHFGKSTNLDMIKRFLEINVDEKERRVSSKSSVNYETFSTNKLQIFQYKHLFDEHFAKHPVIF